MDSEWPSSPPHRSSARPLVPSYVPLVFFILNKYANLSLQCGGFLGETGGWRWVAALIALFSGLLTVIGGLFFPETYPVVLLRRRAALLSKVTGRTYIYKADKGKNIQIKELYKQALSRPWQLLFKEPIVLLLSL